jgi:hypothetical protein
VGLPSSGFFQGLNSVVAGSGAQIVDGTATLADNPSAFLVTISEVFEPPGSRIFSDGFESGDLSAWSSHAP